MHPKGEVVYHLRMHLLKSKPLSVFGWARIGHGLHEWARIGHDGSVQTEDLPDDAIPSSCRGVLEPQSSPECSGGASWPVNPFLPECRLAPSHPDSPHVYHRNYHIGSRTSLVLRFARLSTSEHPSTAAGVITKAETGHPIERACATAGSGMDWSRGILERLLRRQMIGLPELLCF